ncbi:MAG: DUF975 family protein [Oscillospiraceae bacterium]|nr:DUF975 family protein [Oscillospiraceae bacterium]
MYNRAAIKKQAKGLVMTGNPAAWIVTLIYLIATNWVVTIISQLSPFARVTAVMDEWVQFVGMSGGEITEGMMNAMTQEILSTFQGVGASVALLLLLLAGFYTSVVSIGYRSYCVSRMRGEDPGTQPLFSKFGMAAKVILLDILTFVFIYLWSMLFVIPGIVAAYRYSMAPYILLDNPEISPLEAIRRSKKMMAGHKGELFVTELSFFGWGLLAGIVESIVGRIFSAFGSSTVTVIGETLASTAVGMFLTCYIMLTVAGFYNFLLGNSAPPVEERHFEPTDPFGGKTFDDDWIK